MSYHLSFIPGSKPKFNKLYNYVIYKNYDECACIQEKVNTIKTGYNNPLQTENDRISQTISNNLGGKITFGNFGIPAKINYLGRVEGQIGGSLRALKNKY
jgi:hypothetical protein